MIRLPPRSTRTDTLFPYTTLFRSCRGMLLTALAVLAGCATPPHRADDAGHYRVIGYDTVRGNIRPADVARIDTLIFAFAGLVDGEIVLDPAQIARLHQRPGLCLRARARSRCGLRLRSEEHTSELQSLMRNSYAVFCLKKK